MKVIFILGSKHCGSTLLDILLNGHSKIFGSGEVATIHTYHAAAKQEELWRRVAEGLTEGDLEVYRSKPALFAGIQQFYFATTHAPVDEQAFITAHEQLYTRIVEESGRPIISDASKEANRVEILAKSKVIEPVIVHLVRDGRGVTWSFLRKLKGHRIFASTKWFFENIKIEIIRLRLPNVPYVRVRYEDLVHDREAALTKILAAAGVAYEAGAASLQAEAYRGVGGNRMKKNASSDITEDLSWTRDMPLQYLFLFNIFFGWLNWWYRVTDTK